MQSYFDTAETEQTFLIGNQWTGSYRDRYSFDIDQLIQDSIMAWRVNPLARRLAELFKIYNVDGIGYTCEDKATKKALDEFWNDDLNNIEETLEEISNEIFLTGNLFPLYTVNNIGNTYVRIYPTDQIYKIHTAENDVRQELAYTTRAIAMEVESKTFFNNTSMPVFMQHKTINRLAGSVWGEGEMWPDLDWLGRYVMLLKDRVRLNHYRNLHIYDVEIEGLNDEQLKKRKNEILKNPPKDGDINVHGNKEKWTVLKPDLQSGDAEKDILAIKKLIATNHVPLHMLAEPESSTRTTADAAGTPTYKSFENHQNTFKRIIKSILKIVAGRKSAKNNKVSDSVQIEVTSADITERDNAALALATTQIVSAIGEMYDREAITLEEYQRLTYRFMGEVLPTNLPKEAKRKPLGNQNNVYNEYIKTNTETGETRVKEQ
jgi:hypothetical protein